jgi:SAM-dependent methyltransferase
VTLLELFRRWYVEHRDQALLYPLSKLGVRHGLQRIAFARQLLQDPRAQFHTGSVAALPFPDHTFDAALALLVLQDFDDPMQAVKEMARVTRREGTVATTLSDLQGGMPMFALFWRTAETVAPKAARAQRQQNSPPKYASLEDLERLCRTAGLSDMTTAMLELPMAFASFDDFCEPFLGGAIPTTAFAAALDARTGGSLACALRHELTCTQRDGPFILAARAWAVKGLADTARSKRTG